ncbi:MAG: hypothetical protein LBE12_03860 [Planctomycetaceae bacterium]|nr:hypothetical protein [Planctomycetaceae bacterium]
MRHYPLSTIHYPLSTINYQLSTINNLASCGTNKRELLKTHFFRNAGVSPALFIGNVQSRRLRS